MGGSHLDVFEIAEEASVELGALRHDRNDDCAESARRADLVPRPRRLAIYCDEVPEEIKAGEAISDLLVKRPRLVASARKYFYILQLQEALEDCGCSLILRAAEAVA